jgi:ABC-type multidrug transport system ATPase subunit
MVSLPCRLQLVDYVHVMSKGQVVYSARPEELRGNNDQIQVLGNLMASSAEQRPKCPQLPTAAIDQVVSAAAEMRCFETCPARQCDLG